jgi:hypothetical protein
VFRYWVSCFWASKEGAHIRKFSNFGITCTLIIIIGSKRLSLHGEVAGTHGEAKTAAEVESIFQSHVGG